MFLIVIIGTAGGIYLGYSLKSSSLVPPLRLAPSASRPKVDPEEEFASRIGERFPDAEFKHTDGFLGKFHEFFDGTPTVLLFWSMDCEPCVDQAKMWQNQIQPRVRPDVKQVVCIPEYLRPRLTDYAHLLRGKTTVLIDYDRFIAEQRLLFSPAIMSLDGQGLITHIQYGYSPIFDEELYDLLTEG